VLRGSGARDDRSVPQSSILHSVFNRNLRDARCEATEVSNPYVKTKCNPGLARFPEWYNVEEDTRWTDLSQSVLWPVGGLGGGGLRWDGPGGAEIPSDGAVCAASASWSLKSV